MGKPVLFCISISRRMFCICGNKHIPETEETTMNTIKKRGKGNRSKSRIARFAWLLLLLFALTIGAVYAEDGAETSGSGNENSISFLTHDDSHKEGNYCGLNESVGTNYTSLEAYCTYKNGESVCDYHYSPTIYFYVDDFHGTYNGNSYGTHFAWKYLVGPDTSLHEGFPKYYEVYNCTLWSRGYEGKTDAGDIYYSQDPPTLPGQYRAYAHIQFGRLGDKILYSYEYTIKPKTITLEWGDETEFLYDGKPHAPTVEIAQDQILKGDDVSVTRTMEAEAGAHTATAELTGKDSWKYKIQNDSASKDYAIRCPYEVQFDSNLPKGASTKDRFSGEMPKESFGYDETKELTKNAFDLPGYDFKGWNTKADGSGTAYADEEEVTNLIDKGGTVTLYAQWEAKTYKIVFNPGEIGGDEHIQTAYFDQPGTLDVYSDEAFGWNSGGKALHGWAGYGFGSLYEDGATFLNLCGKPRSDGSLAEGDLVAQWVETGQIVVTVTKDNVPQDGLADELTLVDGSGTEFSVHVSYERGQYIFDPSQASWQGSGTAQLPPGEYDLSFEYKDRGYPNATAHIVYGSDSVASAVFSYYTVTYKVENGTWEDGTTTNKTETVLSGKSPEHIPTGMIAEEGFAGGTWDADPGTAAITKPTVFTYVFKPELIITANDQSYEYNDQLQGPGDVAYEDPAEIAEMVTASGLQEGDELTSIILDGQGKEVGEYDLIPSDATVNGESAANKYDVTYVNGTLTITPKPVTVYTVTFVDGQGKILKIQKVQSGKSATAPAAPKRSGYTFAGWDKDFSKVTANMTVTAKWKKNPAPATQVSGTLLVKMTSKGKRSLVLTWNKVNGVDGYDVFFSMCNHHGKEIQLKKVRTIKGNQTFKWTKKSLKKKKPYKAVVKAYVMKNGKKSYVRTSPMVHAYTSGSTKNYTNIKSVTVEKTSISLSKGRTYKIKAKVNKLKKGKKLMSTGHAPKLRYVSSNEKIATVSNSGKIIAKSKGNCKVYVIAVNGASKAVLVTVK